MVLCGKSPGISGVTGLRLMKEEDVAYIIFHGIFVRSYIEGNVKKAEWIWVELVKNV